MRRRTALSNRPLKLAPGRGAGWDADRLSVAFHERDLQCGLGVILQCKRFSLGLRSVTSKPHQPKLVVAKNVLRRRLGVR